MESTNIEKQASRVVKKLRHYGCIVIDAKKTNRRVVISIEAPTAEMEQKAICIKQNLGGIESQILSMQLDGCTIRWNGGSPCPLH